MTPDQQETIRKYFKGRLSTDQIDKIQVEYKRLYKKPTRRIHISQVFHAHSTSSKVWKAIELVAREQRKQDIEFEAYFNS